MSDAKNKMRSKLIDRRQHFKRDFPFLQARGFRNNKTDCNESLKKGFLFEQFIVQLFDPEYFTLVEWRSDKMIGGIAPISNQFPDLEFFYATKNQQQHFAVECKWRQHFKKEKVELARESQLENYRLFEKIGNTPVFIALGIGGEPNKPNAVYTIPLSHIAEGIMHEFVLAPYLRSNPSKMFFLDCWSGKLI